MKTNIQNKINARNASIANLKNMIKLHTERGFISFESDFDKYYGTLQAMKRELRVNTIAVAQLQAQLENA